MKHMCDVHAPCYVQTFNYHLRMDHSWLNLNLKALKLISRSNTMAWYFQSCISLTRTLRLSKLDKIMHSFFLLIVIPLALSTILPMLFYGLSEHTAYAQVVSNVNEQWTDKISNVKILFTQVPEKPLVNSPTELQFIVQNLQTGAHFKNITAAVTITSANTYFKFNKITAADGEFSLKYIFPSPEKYQVIAKIDSKNNSLALASFNVSVPAPPLLS